MRKFSLVLLLTVVLGALPSLAEEPRSHRSNEPTFGARLIRIVRDVFRFKANGDGVLPPWPATPPHP